MMDAVPPPNGWRVRILDLSGGAEDNVVEDVPGFATLEHANQFARRYVNEGFSGGEKKRAEILQMGILDPDLAVMDETDSGLDIDALRTVAEGVNALMSPKLGVVLITHYQRLLNYIKPQVVHILYQGRIIESGGPELALRLEAEGYDPTIETYGAKYGPALVGAAGEKV